MTRRQPRLRWAAMALMMAGFALCGQEVRAQGVACEVEYRINGQWGTGFNTTVLLKNPTDQPIENWTLRWEMPGDEQITQLWNGSSSQTGSSVEVSNLSYNSVIPVGGRVVFGFNGRRTAEASVPAAFSMNGIPCGVPVADMPAPAPAPTPAPAPMPDVQPEPEPEPAPGPVAEERSSKIVEPANGAIVPRKFKVVMEVKGLKVEPSGPVNPDAGHLHILVDTDYTPIGESIPFDLQHLHYGKAQLEAELELEPGPHSLKLQFADGRHVALDGEEFIDEIDVVVAENRILEPADGATVPTTFTVVMAADGLKVEPSGVVNAGAGHLHILVDTAFIAAGIGIPFDPMHIHYGKGQTEAEVTLPPGQHTLKLQFADGLHRGLIGTQYRDEITVNVVADESEIPEDDGTASQPEPEPAGPTGEALYAAQCAGCHGDDGEGLGTFPDLYRAYPSRVAYVQKTVFDMPLANPASCGEECAELVTQYIEQVLLPRAGFGASVVIGPDRPDTQNPTTGGPVAGGDGAGGGSGGDDGFDPIPPKPELACNGETPGPRALRLLTRREYENTTRDLLGVEIPTILQDLPIEARELEYDNNIEVNVITARHIDAYLDVASKLADKAVSQNRNGLLSCDPNRNEDQCARQFVSEVGLKAYRRPLTGEEADGLLSFFGGAGSFDDGMRQALVAMLVSPNFLYRSELGSPAGGGNFQLSPYEIASALSYLFLGSMPDDQLFQAAANNALRTPEQRVAQAQRLIDDPRSRAQIGVFAAQWLGSDPFQTGEKDRSVYPNYTGAVQAASDDELVEFFNHVIFESTGTVQELFEADYVFVNSDLARFYNLSAPGATANDFVKVPVPDGSRGGILGLASVLASYAHSDDSSPIKRGVFVRKRLLCHELPAPPPAIDNTPPGLDPSLTTRERFAAHSASPFCQTCHQYIDDLGFGLERYNGAGEFRQSEFGMPIDDSGSIKALVGFDPDNLNGNFRSVPFQGLRQLSGLLATSPDVPDCLAKQYFRYTRGYKERESDACTIDGLQKVFEASDYDLRTLLISIVNSPSFTLRRAEEGR